MAHTATVETTSVDPRPFVPAEEAGIQHQAKCNDCDWVGPIHADDEQGGSEHAARADAERHEAET